MVIELVTLVLVISYSLYFLQHELKQMLFREGFVEYFKNGWNYVDVTPPIMIILCMLLDLMVDYDI